MVHYCENFNDHEFEETYYGYQCKNCDMFFPENCAPWLPDDDYYEEDEVTIECDEEEERAWNETIDEVLEEHSEAWQQLADL